MSQDPLTHTINFRVSPDFRDEVAAVAEMRGQCVGDFVRRTLAEEMSLALGRSLDPLAALPSEVHRQHSIEVAEAIGNEGAFWEQLQKVHKDCLNIAEAAAQAADIANDYGEYHRLDRIRGNLRQASESVLLAASRLKALAHVQLLNISGVETAAALLDQEG